MARIDWRKCGMGPRDDGETLPSRVRVGASFLFGVFGSMQEITQIWVLGSKIQEAAKSFSVSFKFMCAFPAFLG